MMLQRWYLDWESLQDDIVDFALALTHGKLYPPALYLRVDDPEEVPDLETVFHHYNAGDRPDKDQYRSMCVGDIVVDIDASKGWLYRGRSWDEIPANYVVTFEHTRLCHPGGDVCPGSDDCDVGIDTKVWCREDIRQRHHYVKDNPDVEDGGGTLLCSRCGYEHVYHW